MNATPCPLCNAQPEVERRDRASGVYWIVTHRCEARYDAEPKFYVEMSDDFPTQEKAVETWNIWLEGMKK
jgi:hypothetical protein